MSRRKNKKYKPLVYGVESVAKSKWWEVESELPEEPRKLYSMAKNGVSVYMRLDSLNWRLVDDFNNKRVYTKKNWVLLIPEWVDIKPIFYRR